MRHRFAPGDTLRMFGITFTVTRATSESVTVRSDGGGTIVTLPNDGTFIPCKNK